MTAKIMASTPFFESCHLCGISDVVLLRCGRCRSAWYCGKAHQKLHWKQKHRQECMKFAPDRKETLEKRINKSSSPIGQDCFVLDLPTSPLNLFEEDERKARLMRLVDKVYDDMHRKGYSFIDGFLGLERSINVLNEVVEIHRRGEMHDGEVIKKDLLADNSDAKRIRDDKIAWVDGTEAQCQHIAVQMKEVDSLIKYYNTRLGEYDIRQRSQAMVACYPGKGTHYIKHVDNPTGDGRCITTLYYLNKDWDCEKFGGQLRLYPYGKEYIDIEPIMDRLLLFWSDRRMPHEVLPAYRVRFAITLWYFDAEERAKATLKYQ